MKDKINEIGMDIRFLFVLKLDSSDGCAVHLLKGIYSMKCELFFSKAVTKINNFLGIF